MLIPSPWEYEVSVFRHHYYDRKPTFERREDQYEQWAAFAIEQGSFHYRIGESEGEASAGQIVLCPPSVLFNRRTELPISFHYFLFHWIDEHGKPVPSSSYRNGIHLSFQQTERFYSSLSSLRKPTFVPHSTYQLWRNHTLLDLLRYYSMEQELPPQPYRQLTPDPQMEEARQMLDSACEAPITIGAVANYFDMNGVQFSRRFHRVYGIKPSAYVESIKLDKVCHLLTHTSMTIEQIAHASSFNNGFYLSRFFSLKMRLSPSQYRNQHRV
jgi:AraC family transcriptional regulator